MREMNFSNTFILPNILQGLFLFYHMIDIKILLEYSLFPFLFFFWMLLFEICSVLDIHSQSQATCIPSAQQLCGYVMVAILERAALYFCDCQGWAEVMVIAFVVLCVPRLCR